jgi:hypothetical protein
MNRCPVCFYPDMPYPAADYDICPCCGTEFGNDDALYTPDELRRRWVASGHLWFYGDPPQNWNPIQQLLDAGFNYAPKEATRHHFSVVPAKTTAVIDMLEFDVDESPLVEVVAS